MQEPYVPDAHRMLLGGERVDSVSGETIPVQNPANRSIFAHVPRGGAEDAGTHFRRRQIARQAAQGLGPGQAGGAQRGRVSGQPLGGRQ